MGVKTFSCQVIFISGREITKGNMERWINNKEQYEGEKSFIIMLLLLPFSPSDSSPVPHCAKPLTRRASSRWISTVARGLQHTSEAQRRCLILYLWTKQRQELGGGFFWRKRRNKGNKIVYQLGRKKKHFIIFLEFILTIDTVQPHLLSDKYNW